MNVKLLQKVKQAILDHPKQFEMDRWFQDSLRFGLKGYNVKPAGGCGTAACIGGWAQHLSFGKSTLAETKLKTFYEIAPDAYKLLKLSSDTGQRLFVQGEWPTPFRTDYIKAKTPLQRAKAAAARIDHFIATKGRE